jgi:DNA polymerase-3 subunit epsilon
MKHPKSATFYNLDALFSFAQAPTIIRTHRAFHKRPGTTAMNNTVSLKTILQEIAETLKIARPLTILDVETTGLSPKTDRIVQISFSTVTPSKEVSTHTRLINPEMPIPEAATAIHGISDADVAHEPTFQHIAKSLAESLRGHDFIGYNFRFDQGMLNAEFERTDVPSPVVDTAVIDPLRLWQHLETRTLSDAVERFYGTKPENAHRADVDVDSTARAFVGQLRTKKLPLSIQDLHDITQPRGWLDPEGKIIWRGGAARLNFGKYNGRTLQEIRNQDSGYFKFILKKDFSAEVKAIITAAAEDVYPAAPSHVDNK